MKTSQNLHDKFMGQFYFSIKEKQDLIKGGLQQGKKNPKDEAKQHNRGKMMPTLQNKPKKNAKQRKEQGKRK